MANLLTKILRALSSLAGFNLFYNANRVVCSTISPTVKLCNKHIVNHSTIGDYTIIAEGSRIDLTTIGKFSSIGPNVMCGWGIHPTNGITTSSMFYSTRKQNGFSLSSTDKIVERKKITIGNDVFIGMNAIILDGVTIGDGAIIGAGAVVSKNIPPYAIAVGSPIQIIKYRFDEDTIKKLLEIKWWDWGLDRLQDVEEYFFDIDQFVAKHYKK